MARDPALFGFYLFRVFPQHVGSFPYLFWGDGSRRYCLTHCLALGWLKALRGRPLAGMPKKLRANRVVNRIMWFAYLATNISGAIAWALHFGDNIYIVRVPHRLHVVFGVAWTVFAMAHLAFHWKWIASTSRRYIHVNLKGAGDVQDQEIIGFHTRTYCLEEYLLAMIDFPVEYEC